MIGGVGQIVLQRMAREKLSAEFVRTLNEVLADGQLSSPLAYVSPRTAGDFLLAAAVRLWGLSGLGEIVNLQRENPRDWREINWLERIVAQKDERVYMIIYSAQGQAEEVMKWANKRQDYEQYGRAERAFRKFGKLLDKMDGVELTLEVERRGAGKERQEA